MTFQAWAAFAAATAVLLVIPGPTILLVISYALGQGWRTALPVALGVALGDFTAMTLSMLGVGALLATSASVFTALKWLGAAYLVWLGVKLFRAGGTLDAEPRAADGFASCVTLMLTTAGPYCSASCEKSGTSMRGAVFGVLAATVAGAAAGLAALASLTISEASGACQCWRPATYPPVKATSTALATNVRVSFEVLMSLSLPTTAFDMTQIVEKLP